MTKLYNKKYTGKPTDKKDKMDSIFIVVIFYFGQVVPVSYTTPQEEFGTDFTKC